MLGAADVLYLAEVAGGELSQPMCVMGSLPLTDTPLALYHQAQRSKTHLSDVELDAVKELIPRHPEKWIALKGGPGLFAAKSLSS